ncbi:glutathione peroxidase [Angustibacter peucedani]
MTTSVTDLAIDRLDGTPSTLRELAGGHPLLLVNVASRCGLTPQYAQLEELHERFAPQGFSVVGAPCNQFAGQEPGSADDIATFCSTTYGVTFPLTQKLDVNGPERHPVFEQVTEAADGQQHSGDVRWNFEKFLLTADGEVVERWSPDITPDDPRVVGAVERLLGDQPRQ